MSQRHNHTDINIVKILRFVQSQRVMAVLLPNFTVCWQQTRQQDSRISRSQPTPHIKIAIMSARRTSRLIARKICQSTHYHISLLRRLRRIFPMNLLLQVYKSYIQPRLDYGIILYGCSTQKNIDLVQRVQNHAARLIMGNFDYINCRGIYLVKRLGLYTIRERREYFLTTLIIKALHGITPHYLSDRIDMHFDIHGYNTREAGSMNVYLPAVHKEIYKNSFLYIILVVNFGMNCQIL